MILFERNGPYSFTLEWWGVSKIQITVFSAHDVEVAAGSAGTVKIARQNALYLMRYWL